MFYKNYKCWDIDENKFYALKSIEEKIKFLLNFALLAPSSHNTEPWKFKVCGNELEILADFSRRLPESDKDYRMIYISLGCALTNILIAADYFGLDYEIVWNNEIKATVPYSALKIIFTPHIFKKDEGFALEIAKAVKPMELVDLFNAIKKRRTNRFFYKNIPVSEKYLNEFKKLSNHFEIVVDFVSDEKLKSEIAEIMGEGMKRIMSQKPFRRELAAWLRNNLTLKRDGMPGNGHRMNLFTSIIAPHILRNIDVSDVEREKAIKRVLNFPAVGIISSKEDNPLNFIYAGEILEKLALAIKSAGMDMSIMVAIIEDKESRAKLKNVLNSPFLPQMFFGFGYVERPAPKSPRRNLQDFLLD